MKVLLIIIISLSLLTACSQGSSFESIVSDTSEPSSEKISFINFEICMMINNMRYRLTAVSYTYDLINAEYIGEFIDEVPQHRAPINNMTANFPIEGRKIYKINNETFVVKHERIINNNLYTMDYREMKVDKSNDTKLVRIQDNLFAFSESKYEIFNIGNYSEEYDLDKAEYLGDIIEQFGLDYKIPTEHLTSNLFPVGSKVYRINESIIIVCYEKNNEKTYSVGRIFELD